MRQRLFLILLCALALVGCDKHSEVVSEESGVETAWPLRKTGHWAARYMVPDSTLLESAGWYEAKSPGFTLLDIGANQFLCIDVGVGKTIGRSNRLSEKYEELANIIGDIGYDGYVKNISILVDPVTAIDITTTNDFDSSHKAGSSLADIMNVVYGSYDHFIRNGFKTDDTFHNIPGIHKEADCKDVLLKDAFKEGISTMHLCLYAYFKDKPEVTGEFPIEISITFKSGYKHTQEGIIKL